jgi:hypothetical protein
MPKLTLHLFWALILAMEILSGCGLDHAGSRAEPVVIAPDQQKMAAPTVISSPIPEPDPIVSDPSPSEPVKAVMACRTTGSATAEILVAIRISGSYYLHAEADHGGIFTPLKIEATLPPGIEFVGDWSFPTPEKERGIAVYRTSVLLKRSLRITTRTRDSPKVIGVLRYQACNDELCWPPGKLELSSPLPIQAEATP